MRFALGFYRLLHHCQIAFSLIKQADVLVKHAALPACTGFLNRGFGTSDAACQLIGFACRLACCLLCNGLFGACAKTFCRRLLGGGGHRSWLGRSRRTAFFERLNPRFLNLQFLQRVKLEGVLRFEVARNALLRQQFYQLRRIHRAVVASRVQRQLNNPVLRLVNLRLFDCVALRFLLCPLMFTRNLVKLFLSCNLFWRLDGLNTALNTLDAAQVSELVHALVQRGLLLLHRSELFLKRSLHGLGVGSLCFGGFKLSLGLGRGKGIRAGFVQHVVAFERGQPLLRINRKLAVILHVFAQHGLGCKLCAAQRLQTRFKQIGQLCRLALNPFLKIVDDAQLFFVAKHLVCGKLRAVAA